MDLSIVLQLVVVIGAILIGVRFGGMGLGIWGGVGLCVLTLGFGITPTSPPIDVILIIIAVVTAASAMEASGGIDYLVYLAEKIIRSNPKRITIIAPLTTWVFGFFSGTSHICYPLQPVIFEVSHSAGIRPERPLALSVVTAMLAIAGSPVSAATAAMIGLFASSGIQGWELPQILAICAPAEILAIIITGCICMHYGKDLKDDPSTKSVWPPAWSRPRPRPSAKRCRSAPNVPPSSSSPAPCSRCSRASSPSCAPCPATTSR